MEEYERAEIRVLEVEMKVFAASVIDDKTDENTGEPVDMGCMMVN